MKHLFDTGIQRNRPGVLKDTFMPDNVRAAGLPLYWGAEFDFPTCPAFSEGVLKAVRSALPSSRMRTTSACAGG